MPTGTVKVKLKEISQVQDILNRIPNINRGGCGISALALARWIKKNKPMYDVHFILAYDSQKDFKNNTEIICKDQNKKAVAVAHAGVVIEMNNGGAPAVVDSQGAFGITRYECSHTFAYEAIMVKAINEGSQWNPEFDRKNVYRIEELLEIDLSDVSQIYPTNGYTDLATVITKVNETKIDPIGYIKNLWTLLTQ